jgi:putative endonuclease
MSSKQYYMYILSNQSETLYVGVTNNLIRRVYEHKNKLVDGFTKKYDINILLYYEIHTDIQEAIIREKKIKHWNHEWKIQLAKSINPKLDDLYDSVLDLPSESGR